MASADQRREQRLRTMTVQPATLHSEPEADDPRGTDAVLLAARLSHDAWVMTGKAIPRLPRAELPVRWRALGDDADAV